MSGESVSEGHASGPGHPRPFGLTADGRTVHAALLRWPSGLEVEVLDYGAIVHRLRLPTPEGLRDMVLSYDDLDGYQRDTAYIGAVVGRVANRIAGGRFPLDGREVQVSVNEPPNTLHGGRIGFNKRLWRFEDVAADGRSLVLAYDSPNGEEGFPGRAHVQAHFTLTGPDTLEIGYVATADAPTALALSQHLYFNLSGDPSALITGHRLQIAAESFTPVDAGMIPTGEIAPVADTPLDLRRAKPISEVLARPDAQMAFAGGIDFNWALSGGAEPALRLEAEDGAWLELTTDQPGVQVYSGHKLTAPFVKYGGLAIEPQGYPDAVNHPNFPSALLRPGETYRRHSRYRFGVQG